MRVSRIYTPVFLSAGKTIELDDEASHYIRTVLRLKKQADITLFNGDGYDYQSQLIDVNRKTVVAAIQQEIQRSVESPLTVTLGVSIARGDRMDLSIQKAVELGVHAITPLVTERCVVQLLGDKKMQRLAHWQKIVHHAAEQSGRTTVPILADIETLADWLPHQRGLKVFLDPHANTSLSSLQQPEDLHVTLLTGPEGGFTDQERDIAKAAGFLPIRLGARILRTETASLAALASVQMLWGDFAG
jgi:16S rRNA (uracil1498-N3)-methyltransferase